MLYRRKDDQIMCILKEINMLDLSASDRQVNLQKIVQINNLMITINIALLKIISEIDNVLDGIE